MRILKISCIKCDEKGLKYTWMPKDSKHSGHMDTQMYPECAGTKYDRDIVKKQRNKKKKVATITGLGIKTVESKKKSPKQHGFIDQCIKENSDKKDPGAYCASIVDKVKGTTNWRKKPKKESFNLSKSIKTSSCRLY